MITYSLHQFNNIIHINVCEHTTIKRDALLPADKFNIEKKTHEEGKKNEQQNIGVAFELQ